MLNEVKHLAIAREILRCAQNDIVHHLTCDRILLVTVCTCLPAFNPGVIVPKIVGKFGKNILIKTLYYVKIKKPDVYDF